MKTIEITSGDQKVQFTTKSVTFDGKEFLYAHMTNVIHSTEKRVYTFTYDGEVKLLPYDEKDEKTLNAIFGQVQKMAAQKKAASKAKAAEASVKASGEPAMETSGQTGKSAEAAESTKTTESVNATENAEAAESAKTAENAQAAKATKADDEKKAADADAKGKDTSVKVADFFGKSKSKKSKKGKAGETETDTADVAKTEAGDSAVQQKEKEKPQVDPEKAASRKKSLKIFAIIIAILLVCSVAYYFIFGTPSDPAPINSNTEETQQYEDIDQLIEDLQ